MYIYFTDNKVANTVMGPDELIFDINAKGDVIGIKILNASNRMDNPLSTDYKRIDNLSMNEIWNVTIARQISPHIIEMVFNGGSLRSQVDFEPFLKTSLHPDIQA